jgi:hypothetical protein
MAEAKKGDIWERMESGADLRNGKGTECDCEDVERRIDL